MVPSLGEGGETGMGMTAAPADINYTFNDAELAMLAPYGEVRRHGEGDVLVQEGDRRQDCLVTLSGEIHIFVEMAEGPRRLGWMERGQFGGDITVLTGHASMARTTMGVAGEVLHIPYARFQKLLVENSHLSDVFVRTFTARRAFALNSDHASVIVIGEAGDRGAFTVRELLSRHSVPHSWFDPSDALAARVIEARGLSGEDLPAVVFGAAQALVRPTANEVAERLGFDLVPDGATVDVVIIGAGPAGLAAAVYAASEGLSVVTVDAEGPGGQAGSSSKIENYLGFPMGLAGRELADRAAVQAQKFGVRIASPARAAALEKREEKLYCLGLEDGRSFLARSVVIATGAQYRSLPINGLERFEGRGVYYGASPLEAQLCADADVAIVGAGNSAGQAAVFLSRTAKSVHVLYRRPDIRETMSEYLVRRLEDIRNITLHPKTEIAAFDGDAAGALAGVSLKVDGAPGGALATPHIFLFIGAAPYTNWLPDTVARDGKGFLKTGPSLANLDLVKAGWDRDRMPTAFETSWPRVYAVGDVRSGSIKRVASSVGEGSVVVSAIHQVLTER